MFEMLQLKEMSGQMENLISGRGWLICKGIFGIYVCALAIMDIRTRKLHFGFLISGFLIAAAGWKYRVDAKAAYVIAGFIAGLICMAISRITEESFGYGDSILVMILGSFLGIWELLYVMLFASALAALYSVMMILTKKMNRKSTIPFVPFIASGYIGGMMIGIF